MGMQYSAAMIDQVALDALGTDPGFEQVIEILGSGIDLGKMWNAAQVVLGGSLEAGEPLMTGVPFGEDAGYGPALLASPADVARVASELEGVSMEQLVARVDVNELHAQAAYPGIWLSEPADSLAAEVGGAAWRLADLYLRAAREGCSVLAAIY